jgi:hypothetical protein
MRLDKKPIMVHAGVEVHRGSGWEAWPSPNGADADLGEGGDRRMDVHGRRR